MTKPQSNCLPVRLRTAKGEPVTPIFWGDRDLAEVDHFTLPQDGKDVRIDVVGRSRKLIKDTLVWEMNITRHMRPAATLSQRLLSRWQAELPNRRAEEYLWTTLGLALGAVLFFLLLFARDLMIAIFLNPLASMVWVWVTLGWVLPFLAVILGVFWVNRMDQEGRPFLKGFAISFGILALMLSLQIAQSLQGFVNAEMVDGALAFPASYDAAGTTILQSVIDSTARFYDQIEVVWTPITLILNGLGLAGVVTLIDTLGGAALKLRDAREEQEQSAQSGRFDANAVATAREDKMPRAFELRLPLTPLDDPNDDIPERPEWCC